MEKKKQFKKKFLSLVLCLALIMSCLPSNVLAVETGLPSIHVMDNEQYTVDEDRTVSSVHIGNGATLTIPAGVTLTIQADLHNFGTVTNSGTLAVAGTLYLNGDETLVNDGTMTVTGDVFHEAAITGSGKITVNGTVYGANHDYESTEKCMACGWQVDVTVNMPNGSPYGFTIRNTATIGEVKAELNSRFSQYAAENMRLIYDGQVTEDSKSLLYYGADTSITLTMVYEERYNLWIGGEEVTSAKTSGEGWSYDPTTNTLTLNGASITSGSHADASIYATDALNIVLTGSNTVSGGANFGIYADSSVSFSGDGSLTAVGHWDGIQAHGAVTINSGTINFVGESSYGIKAEGNTLTFNGGYVCAEGGASGSGIVASSVVLGNSSHLVVTHGSAAVAGTLSATGGMCRTSASGTFTETIAASGAYFEYLGANHVTYTNKNAQDHTVACVHGISFDTAHKYENGSCTACSNLNGSLDVSRLSTDLIITATGYSMNGKSYLYEGNYTLTGTTSYGVIFEAGEYQLTANNLKIVKDDGYSGSAIELKNGATLHLVLADGSDNTLTGGWEGSGIRVNEGTSLEISGDGILRAGYQQGTNGAHGAAIGGYCDSNFGTITISGGTIYATGTNGASIGSGSLFNTSNTMTGTIVINGGTVYADLIGNAQSSGAVLKGSGGTIYCNYVWADTSELNKIVYSKDGTSATYYCNDFVVKGDIANCSWDQTNKVLNINGGTVTVSNADKNTATGQRIYIRGVANVTLDGVNIKTGSGAPVEIHDFNDTNVTLTLQGSNTLISQKINKAAIHKTREESQPHSGEAATLTINGPGSLTAVGGNNAAGIGGGNYYGDVHNITINGGTIHATGTGYAAGIGASNGGSTWNIYIKGGYVTANGNPGIGSAVHDQYGVRNTYISGGMVVANSYSGQTPTGGLVSTDGGKTYTVYENCEIDQDLQIASDGRLEVRDGKTLSIGAGKTLTNLGTIENYGTINGNIDNQGIIYNTGTLPAGTTGTVLDPYVIVENGNGSGNYAKGTVVEIVANAPESGKVFIGWSVKQGTVTLEDKAKPTTTFTMPAGCVTVKATYADIEDIRATITDSNGVVTYYTDNYRAQEDWCNDGGTLTVYTDDCYFMNSHIWPSAGVLDLNGHSVNLSYLDVYSSCTIKNGTILLRYEGEIVTNAVVTFENVTIAKEEGSTWDVVITNDGTIVDAGLTLNDVTISGNGTQKKGLAGSGITFTGIPDAGYTYDGMPKKPGVRVTWKTETLTEGEDYEVSFSHSGTDNTLSNAGTVTVTVTGMGDYADSTVTKTYTIGKAALTVTAEDKTATYGDAVPNYTVTYRGFKGDDNKEHLRGSLSFACDYTPISDKGTYTITPSGLESGNYEISYVPGTLTVNPKPITVTIANKTSVYGEEIVELTASTAEGALVNNDTNVYSLATTATKTSNAGKYDIVGTVLNNNYSITFENGEDAYEITKAQAVGTAPTAVSGLVYNKSAQTLITAGSTNDGTMVYSLEKEGEYTPELPQATATGTYYVWYKVIGDGNHNDTAPISVEVKIDKADPSIGTVTAGVVSDTLETSAIVLTRTNTNVEGNLIVDAGQTLVLGENEIAYTFVPTDSNYKAVTGTVTVTVVDTIAPTGTVTLATNNWTNFLNNITFGLFFKENQTVSVVASDNLSGVAKIEYIESKTAMDLDAVKAATRWTEMKNGSVSVTLEDTKQFVYYIRITDKSGNVSYLSSDGAEYDTSVPVIAGVNNGVTYHTTQKVTINDKNIDTVTLNGEAATSTITLEGNKEATYIIVATDKAGNTTTVTVKMAPIADIAESMDGMTSNDVTSADKTALQTIVDTVTELLKDEELPAEEKEALEKAQADAEALLAVIENANKAADTENTDKVEDVTADNVTPEDKSDLEKAKADLEKALDDNSGNYTAEEKKAIKDELKRINDALKVIENVETVEVAVSNLPATVVPDDEENVAKIEAAKKAYAALSTYEKSLVSKQTKETLDKLTAAAVAYDIVKGDGSEWKEDSNETLSFTANGAVSRFLGIEINSKTLDPKHYEVKAGSTIVTLKQDYLDTLEAGKYTITFLYTNGETEGTFIVEAVEEETVPPTTEGTVPPTTEETKPSTVPETGDDANVMLWTTMLLFSVMAITALGVYNKKFAYKAKYVRK